MAMASIGLKSSSSPFSVFVVVFLSLCCCFVLCDEGIAASPRKTVNDNVYSVGVPVTSTTCCRHLVLLLMWLVLFQIPIPLLFVLLARIFLTAPSVG